MFQHDTGRCDHFLFVSLNDPEVERIFGKLRKEHVANITEELMSEWYNPHPYHGDASFCDCNGQLTASDWETDTEELMEGVSLSSQESRK